MSSWPVKSCSAYADEGTDVIDGGRLCSRCSTPVPGGARHPPPRCNGNWNSSRRRTSDGLPRTDADQLAAITAGLSSLTRGAARCFAQGTVSQVMVEMSGGFLLVMAVSDGSNLTVLADVGADVGLVGYEMARFVARADEMLTTPLRRELPAALPL